MYKAAIIGCGMIAGRFEDFSVPRTYSHAKAYRKNSAIGDLAFYDPDAGRASELAAKTSGRDFATLSEIMADFRPDIVSVCTPDNLHFSTTELHTALPAPTATSAVTTSSSPFRAKGAEYAPPATRGAWPKPQPI